MGRLLATPAAGHSVGGPAAARCSNRARRLYSTSQAPCGVDFRATTSATPKGCSDGDASRGCCMIACNRVHVREPTPTLQHSCRAATRYSRPARLTPQPCLGAWLADSSSLAHITSAQPRACTQQAWREHPAHHMHAAAPFRSQETLTPLSTPALEHTSTRDKDDAVSTQQRVRAHTLGQARCTAQQQQRCSTGGARARRCLQLRSSRNSFPARWCEPGWRVSCALQPTAHAPGPTPAIQGPSPRQPREAHTAASALHAHSRGACRERSTTARWPRWPQQMRLAGTAAGRSPSAPPVQQPTQRPATVRARTRQQKHAMAPRPHNRPRQTNTTHAAHAAHTLGHAHAAARMRARASAAAPPAGGEARACVRPNLYRRFWGLAEGSLRMRMLCGVTSTWAGRCVCV